MLGYRFLTSLASRSWLDRISSCFVIVAAIGLLWQLYGPNLNKRSSHSSPVKDICGVRLPADGSRNVRGDGRVVLVEFADYQCEFCARHAKGPGRQLEAGYVKTGKLRHVVLNFPLPIHQEAQKAAEASECAADQGRFWEMRQRLYSRPSSLQVSVLTEQASDIGLDGIAFEACLSSGSTVSRVQRHVEMAHDLGVFSTPSFFLGVMQPDGAIILRKRLIGALPYEVFRDAISDVESAISS